MDFFRPFMFLLNNRGEVNTEGGEKQEEGQKAEQEEKLYAGKYKNPEELEEGYKNQQNLYENLQNKFYGLEQQFSQLNARLAEKTPSGAKEEKDYSSYFDKDSLSAIKDISRQEARRISEETLGSYHKLNQFQEELSSSWKKAQNEYGKDFDFMVNGEVNPESELYKRADEILVKKYVRRMPGGQVVFTNSDAHYLATTEAYAQLTREGKSRKPSETSQDRRQRMGNLSGKSGAPSGKGKITKEAYLKLSDEEKDAYDRREVESRGGEL